MPPVFFPKNPSFLFIRSGTTEFRGGIREESRKIHETCLIRPRPSAIFRYRVRALSWELELKRFPLETGYPLSENSYMTVNVGFYLALRGQLFKLVFFGFNVASL